MQNSWPVLIPPLVVIILAVITQRILFSLLMGIVSAALIIHDFVLHDALIFMIKRIWSITELQKLTSLESLFTGSNIFVCSFLLILGCIIAMIHRSGAAYAYGNFIVGRIKSARGAESASLFLSTLFFFDDYFSCLTVGSVMQPVTDRFKVPRAKLALLVSAITAPLALVVPLSSWVAEITGQFRNAGVSIVSDQAILFADPLHLYLNVMPCMFYALIMIASLWYMVYGRISFGILGNHEKCAQNEGNLFGGKIAVGGRSSRQNSPIGSAASLWEFILPIGILFVSIFVWISCVGGWWLVGGTHSLLEAIQQANIFAGLFCGGLIAACITFVMMVIKKRFAWCDVYSIVFEGFELMGSAIVMLILIWSLSSMLARDLDTGNYIAQKLIGHLDIWLLPAMFFCLAMIISSLIGTAWGTLGMLIPLALRMVPALLGVAIPFELTQTPMLIPVLGAIISGAIVGNHVSPIADMMLMAATSAGAYHLDVVKSLMSFSIPTALSALIAFLVVGKLITSYSLLIAATFAVGIGIPCNIIAMHILQWIWRR